MTADAGDEEDGAAPAGVVGSSAPPQPHEPLKEEGEGDGRGRQHRRGCIPGAGEPLDRHDHRHACERHASIVTDLRAAAGGRGGR